MKICVISFDFWNYDEHIVDVLQQKGIDGHHINIGAYRHKNVTAKITNAFSKVFLKKNLKNINRQELIINSLKKLGHQDQILIINPESIDRKYHLEIKKYTNKYIAYLYDSLARNPAEHLLDLFDDVFSFDKHDVEKHGFKLITNYNYLPEQQYNPNTEYDLVYLASIDNRLNVLTKVEEKLNQLGKSYFFYISGKKAWKKQFLKTKKNNVVFSRKRIPHQDILNYYSKGKVILDLVRDQQVGLSFRIFEAMALKKKIITNNPTITQYSLYNPNNILLLNKDCTNITKEFFETPYHELPREIYNEYTLEHWVETVFNL